jgi:hypothetical protein
MEAGPNERRWHCAGACAVGNRLFTAYAGANSAASYIHTAASHADSRGQPHAAPNTHDATDHDCGAVCNGHAKSSSPKPNSRTVNANTRANTHPGPDGDTTILAYLPESGCFSERPKDALCGNRRPRIPER